MNSVEELANAVAPWRKAAADIGLKAPEIERMETAFEHEDPKQAKRNRKSKSNSKKKKKKTHKG